MTKFSSSLSLAILGKCRWLKLLSSSSIWYDSRNLTDVLLRKPSAQNYREEFTSEQNRKSIQPESLPTERYHTAADWNRQKVCGFSSDARNVLMLFCFNCYSFHLFVQPAMDHPGWWRSGQKHDYTEFLSQRILFAQCNGHFYICSSYKMCVKTL